MKIQIRVERDVRQVFIQHVSHKAEILLLADEIDNQEPFLVVISAILGF